MKKILLLVLLSPLFLFLACDDSNPPADDLIDYGNHPLQNFELLLPENHDENTEVVIMIHGGGWTLGFHPNKRVTTFSSLLEWNIVDPLLNQGYACVLMKYRTSCYNTVPILFNNNTTYNLDRMKEDIDLVISHLKDNASDYGISDSDFHLVGESAGAHLAMSYGLDASSQDINSIISMYGPADLDAQDFKQVINNASQSTLQAPFYIRNKLNNCNSVTNFPVKPVFFMKSFTNHNDFRINNINRYMDFLSANKNIERDIPLFIMQGDSDGLVPSTQADIMETAMQNAFNAPACPANDFDCQLKKKFYANCNHAWADANGNTCQKSEVEQDVVSWIMMH